MVGQRSNRDGLFVFRRRLHALHAQWHRPPARNKSKTAKKAVQAAEPVKKEEQKAAGSPTAPGLFDIPAPAGARPTRPAPSDEEAEILAEIKQDRETEEEDEDEAVVAS